MVTTGTYTVECPRCKNSAIVHVASDGSFYPHKCSKCELECTGIGSGEQRHSFVGLVKKAEEIEKTDKKPFETFQFTKKTGKKPLKW